MHCYLTSCFVCEHSRLMVTKPNSEISGGRSHILQATFLARGQIDNVFRITGKSGMDSVFFAHLKTRKWFRFHKKIMAEVASIPIAFETTIFVVSWLSIFGGFETGWCQQLLITKEAYWSAQLFSLAPHGLNKRKEFHSKNRICYN